METVLFVFGFVLVWVLGMLFRAWIRRQLHSRK